MKLERVSEMELSDFDCLSCRNSRISSYMSEFLAEVKKTLS